MFAGRECPSPHRAVQYGTLNFREVGPVELRIYRALAAHTELWLALPEADEETEPAFYHYPGASIPAADIGGVAVRVLMGAALVWGARGSRMPRTLLAIGALMILGGLLSPFFGIERLQVLVAWFASLGPVLTRTLASVAVLLGAFIAHAARPAKAA